MYLHHQIPIISSVRACIKAVQEILQCPIVALDCEGVNLSRNGKLCLIQIATPTRVYLFDVLKGGERLFFDKGLRAVLENRRIMKIVHDCRRDSEALYYQYGVRLRGVWDSQVAHAILSQLKGNKTPYPVGLNTLFRLCGVEENQFKDSVKNAMSVMRNFWEVRPLSRMMVDYAAGDVKSLLNVYSMINAELTLLETDYNFKKLIEAYSAQYACMNITEADGADELSPRTASYNLYGIKLWDEDIGLGTRNARFAEYQVYHKSVCPAVSPSQAAKDEEEESLSEDSDGERVSSEEEETPIRVRRYDHTVDYGEKVVYADGYQYQQQQKPLFQFVEQARNLPAEYQAGRRRLF